VAIVKKYNLAGQEVGQVTIDDRLVEAKANLQMIKDYLVALRANARQWSANTKSRDEVCHSGQKPHPQKGTGRARQGYLGAPQYKGGGRVHTPKPKFDQHVRINQKEKKSAIKHLLSEKIQNHNIHVLQFENLDAPKTKVIAEFLKARQLTNKRVLFLAEGALKASKKGGEVHSPVEKYAFFAKSTRNIPKVEFKYMPTVNGYDLTLSNEIVIMDSAMDELMVLLGGKS
jgi:large subunit ribosomal protein L4